MGLLSLIMTAQAQTDVSLDGEWQLTVRGKDYHVQVPHTYNLMDSLEDYAGEAVYRRLLPISPDMKGKTVRLCFEAVYHDAIVYVNGQKVGEHLNKGYTPFSMDITKALLFGCDNTLEVKVSNTYTDKAFPYMRHFDWANDGGIYRSVRLHVSGQQTLRYVHVTPSLNGKARFDIRLWEDRVNKIKGRLTVRNRQSGDTVFDSDLMLAKRKASHHYSATITIANPQLWHFDHPNLYDFTFSIPGSDALSDHFGFREFKVEGRQFVLNGEPVRLPGIESMSGSHPLYGMAEPADYIGKTVRMMKDLNTTITRFHWVQDQQMLNLMDETGILCQEELSWWQQPRKELSPELRQTAKEALEEMIEAHYNHPCIYGWGISNECATTMRNCNCLATTSDGWMPHDWWMRSVTTPLRPSRTIPHWCLTSRRGTTIQARGMAKIARNYPHVFIVSGMPLVSVPSSLPRRDSANQPMWAATQGV